MKLALIIAIPFLATIADARDASQVRAFRKGNPCPTTGQTTGACKEWIVNHKKALCLGGLDDPSNMEWQEYKESLRMDVLEREACMWKRKYEELLAK
jgi:hypothetical protein